VPGESPQDYVQRLAIWKSAAALEMLTIDKTAGADGGVLVIGADTAVQLVRIAASLGLSDDKPA